MFCIQRLSDWLSRDAAGDSAEHWKDGSNLVCGNPGREGPEEEAQLVRCLRNLFQEEPEAHPSPSPSQSRWTGLDNDRSISFSAHVEAVDAASRACVAPARDIRERTPTGYIQDGHLDTEERSVKFGNDVSVLQAASSGAHPGQARSIRERTPTGFISDESAMAPADDRSISFNTQVEAVDAASRACVAPARDIRERTPTGYIQDGHLDTEERSVKFGNDVSVVQAASSGAHPGQARSIRERTPTGFISGECAMAPVDDRSINFNAQVEAVDAASRACVAPARDIRERTPTGYIQDVHLDTEEKSVKFGNDVSVLQAASSGAHPGQARSIRERTPTGFIADESAMAPVDDRSINFNAQVEAVDAASRACVAPARDIRERTPTGYIQDVHLDTEEKSVKFGNDVSVVQAASSGAHPGQARSIRERTPTGFISDESAMAPLDDRSINFSAQVEAVDAASRACVAPARDIRERTPTGYIQDIHLDTEDKSVKFGNDVSVLQAASSGAHPGQARSIRERTPTGFISDESAMAPVDDRSINFNTQVEAVDAASRACVAPARDIRERTPTGYIQDIHLDTEDKSVKFGNDVSVLQAASSGAHPGQARSIRERTPTGFISDESAMAPVDDRSINFSAQVEAVDAASRACVAPARDIRERTPTGYIQDIHLDTEDKSVKFGNDVSVLQAASSGAHPGQARSIRERTPTGFISDESAMAPAGDRSINFNTQVEAVDAASMACVAPARDIRERTPTGYIQDGHLDPDEKSVKFGNDVSFLQAASTEALPGQARRVSDRIPTGFISEDVTITPPADERSISFSTQVVSVDAASKACTGPSRDVRERTPTGYIQDGQFDTEEKSVKFGNDVSFLRAASTGALPGQARRVSERIPTGFISEDATTMAQSDERSISFSAQVEAVDAASKACAGPSRDVRERTPTGYIQDGQFDTEEKSVKFGNDVSFLRAASTEALPGQARRVSERIPTGFISEDVTITPPADERSISFSTQVVSVDAASKACTGPSRDVRERTPTGYIQDGQFDTEEKSVKFGNDVSFLRAASTGALPGQARRVSERIPTGFISEDATTMAQSDERSISFSAQVEAVDAASKACAGPSRDVRERTPTGYIQDGHLDTDEKSVKFGNDVSFLQAASTRALPGQARRISERMPTGFISEDMTITPPADERSISFSAQVVSVDAADLVKTDVPGSYASSAGMDDGDAGSRGVPGRATTGFVHRDEVLPGEVRAS